MKLEPTTTSYAVEIPVDDFLLFTDRETIYGANPLPVHEQLDVKLMELGCTKIDYNGHYGSWVYLTIDCETDTPAFQAQVLKLIEDHITGLRP